MLKVFAQPRSGGTRTGTGTPAGRTRLSAADRRVVGATRRTIGNQATAGR